MADTTAWLDFLSWVKQPGHAVQNALAGKAHQAGANLSDFLLDIPDAVIPGDVFARQSDPKENAKVGNKYGQLALDVGLNPLTYTAFIPGVGPAMRNTLVAGAKAAGEVPGVRKVTNPIRHALGWTDIDPAVHGQISKAVGAGEVTSRAATTHVANVIKAARLTPVEDKALTEIFHNAIDFNAPTRRVLAPHAQPIGTADMATKMQAVADRLAAWKAAKPTEQVDDAKLLDLSKKVLEYNARAADELTATAGLSPTQREAIYLYRDYQGMDSSTGNMKPRQVADPTEMLKFLGANKHVTLNESFTKTMLNRAEKQGHSVKQGVLLRELNIDPAVYRAEELAGQGGPAHDLLTQAINAAGGRGSDTGHRIAYEMGKFAVPNTPVGGALDAWNRVFKGAYIHGVGPVPRIGALFRNRLTAVAQMMQDPVTREQMLKNPQQFVKDLFGAVDDGIAKNLFGKRFDGSELSHALDTLDEAFNASGGTREGVRSFLAAKAPAAPLYQQLLDAIDHNVISNVVSAEKLARTVAKNYSRLDPRYWLVPGASPSADIGSVMYQGLENRMRLGSYLDQVRKGIDPAEAALRTKTVFYDYDVSDVNNRRLRQVFPFIQFPAQAIKQTTKTLAGAPYVLPAVATLFGDEQGDLPKSTEQQVHLPLGDSYLHGVGAPSEAMNMLPVDQEGLRRTAAALHPAAQIFMGLVAGNDLFTGKPFLQDARIPFTSGPQTQADRIYGLVEKSGLAAPLTAPARNLAVFDNPATGPGEEALRFLTGIRRTPSAPERSETEDITDQLKRDPRARQVSSFYAPGKEPDIAAAIKRLKEIRQELNAKLTASAGMPATPATPADRR